VRRLRPSYPLGPAGGGLLLVLVAAIVVLVAGPSQDRTPAAVVLALIVFLLVARPAGTRFAMARTLEESREAPPAATGAGPDEPAEENRGAGERGD
jgi:hypothetical protein